MTKVEQFDEIKQRLENLKEDINNFDRRTLDECQIQELARAEKVVEYLLLQINTIDVDLLPRYFYDDVKGISNWDTQSITSLNEILDNILVVLNKYRNFNTTKELTSQNINDILKTYNNSINKSLKTLNLSNVKNNIKIIEDYKEQLLNTENGTQKQIADSRTQIQTWFDEIQKFNNAFFIKQDNKETSIKADIESIQNNINSSYRQICDITRNFTQKLTDIDTFYVKIFGTVENNQRVGGLQQGIKDRQNQLDEYDKNQKEVIEALKKEIANLLTGATNASLASSYEKSKKSYHYAIIGWNIAFVLSMFGILGVAIWGFVEVAERLNEPLVVLGAILVRLPLYAPLAWLAIFATRRRNEIKRLQEEYKHKETFARSFLGYKEQIDKIQDTQKDILTAKLMENLVEMTNENPNKSLDKTNKENIPRIDFFEKFAKSPEEARSLFKEFMSMFKGITNANK